MGLRRGVLSLLALVPVIPIVIGALIGPTSGNAASGKLAFTPAAGQPTSRLSSTPAFGSSGIPGGSGALVALVIHATQMRATPGGRTIHALGTRTEFGSAEVLWVVARSPGWLGVNSPLAGNGRIGWIPESAVSFSRVTWELRVSLSARRLTVLQGTAVRQQYTVAVGRADAPTPTGRFAVSDLLATGDPTGPYGCCVLALTARSPHAILDWTGGDRIAIHSTPDTGSIGQPVSHGCMRLTIAEGRWLMNHVPLGTPTLISG